MNTSNNKPYWSIRIGILIFLLPLYALVLLRHRFGIIDMSGFFGELPMSGRWIFAAMIISFLASLFLLIKTGKTAFPVLLLFLCVLPMHFCTRMVRKAEDKARQNEYTLDLRSVNDTDVYCNGVFLGKIPLKITKEDFYGKVKPWDKPPLQEMTSIKTGNRQIDFTDGYLYWIPNDPFEYHAEYPGGQIMRPFRHLGSNDKVFEIMKDTKYWWHFENSEHSGIAWMNSFSSGAGASNNKVTIDGTPNVSYPSVDKHFSIIIEALQISDYKPTQQWLDHFQKHQNLMFLKFYNYVKKESKTADALDAIVRHQFNIGPNINRQDCVRVLDEIYQRLERAGSFTVPSIESLAAEMVCAEHEDVLSEHYIDSLKWAYAGSHGRSWGSDFNTYRRDGKGVRNALMQYLVNIYQPEDLYNRLVYECIDHDESIYLAVNYIREESETLFDHYLRNAEESGRISFGRNVGIDNAIRQFEMITNPELQGRIWQFISIHRNAGSFRIDRFIENRMKTTPQDPQLLGMIFDSKTIDEYQKTDLIAKLSSGSVSHHLSYLSSVNPKNRDRALEVLSRSPNPYAEKFLIESYKYYNRSENKGKSLRNWVKAAIETNTPEIRKLIESVFEKSGEEKERLLNQFPQSRWSNPEMDWMVPILEKLTEKKERLKASAILTNIGSDNAIAVLEKWSQDADKKIADNAKYHLDKIRSWEVKSRVNAAIDQETIDGVISGRTKPDDLLDGSNSFVWDGEKYVPEKPAQ